MPHLPSARPLSLVAARRIWLRAQRLDEQEPFGVGPAATRAAVEHLGYVQIDTIHVVERSHHHILFTRIPEYRCADLHQAQAVEKSVFEYWTHALSYVPTEDFRFFVREMRRQREKPHRWFGSVTPEEVRRVLRLLRTEGPLTIRDIEDEVLVEKHHPWASRKPSKRALQLAFHMGLVAVSERNGMLKTYDLIDRHFGWERPPRPATERQISEYMLDRALRAQRIVSLDSICFQDAPRKPAVRKIIETRVRRGELVPVAVEGAGKQQHWAPPEALENLPRPAETGRSHGNRANDGSSPPGGEVGRAERRPGEGEFHGVGPLTRRTPDGARRPLPEGERKRQSPEAAAPHAPEELVHILSPFDPLIIQRKRLKLFFGYEHRFEAYVPKEKRVFGYFALPVLFGDAIVAAIDLKADRAGGRLLIRKWTWVGGGRARSHKRRIEEALHRFERFQLNG